MAETLFRLGSINTQLGFSNDADASYKEALKMWKDLSTANPASTYYRSQQAHTHLGLGKLQGTRGDAKSALASFQEAVSIGRGLVRVEPTSVAHRHVMSLAYKELGIQQARMGDPGASLNTMLQAAAIWEQLLKADADQQKYGSDLASARGNILNAKADLIRRGTTKLKTDLEKQEDLKTIAQMQELAGTLELQFGKEMTISQKVQLAGLYRTLSGLLTKQEEGLPYCEKAVQLGSALVSENPAVVEFKRDLGVAYSNLSRMQASAGIPADKWKQDDAKKSHRMAISIFEELCGKQQDNAEYRLMLGHNYVWLAFKTEFVPVQDKNRYYLISEGAHFNPERNKELVLLYGKGTHHLEQSLALDSKSDRCRQNLIFAYGRLTVFQSTEDAKQSRLRTVEIQRQMAAINPDAPRLRSTLHSTLAGQYVEVAAGLAAAGKAEEVIAHWQKAINECTQHADIEDHNLSLQLYKALRGLARSQINVGELEGAQGSLLRQIEVLKSPSSSKRQFNFRNIGEAYYHLGKTQSDLGKLKEAKQSWLNALEALQSIKEADRDNLARALNGMSLYSLGRLQEGREVLEQIAIDESGVIRGGMSSWYLIMTLHRLGEIEKARSYYDALVVKMDAIGPMRQQTERIKQETEVVLGIRAE